MHDGYTTVTITNGDFVKQPQVGEVWESSNSIYLQVISQVGTDRVLYSNLLSVSSGWYKDSEERISRIDKFLENHKHIGWLVGWRKKEIKLK